MRIPFFRRASVDDPTAGQGLALAKIDFKKIRGEFYEDLASSMIAMPGKNIRDLLEPYAERYAKKSEGRLAAFWLRRMDEDVAMFADALVGTVPREDIAAIAVAEGHGDLALGLQSLARNIRGMDEAKKVLRQVMVTAVAALVILHVFMFIEGFVLMPKILAALGNLIKPDEWGSTGKAMNMVGAAVRGWGWVVVAVEVVVASWMVWSFSNYTGRARPWLDRNILFYQLYRDFSGAAFLATLGAVTKKIGNNVQSVSVVLEKMEEHAYPWLTWHIRRIKNNIEQEPNSKGEVFNTGIVNDRAYYRIVDIAEYDDMSTMLDKVGEIVLKTAPVEMAKKATIVRHVVTVVVLLCMMSFYFGTMQMNQEFKSSIERSSMMRG